jgi:hypothetical protein
MIAITKFPQKCIEPIVCKLFNTLAHGLFLGVAPDNLKDPYHFLMLCHGGFDPTIQLNNYLKKIVKIHKQTGSLDQISFIFEHPYPDYSGLLKTNFRSNRYIEEEENTDLSIRKRFSYIFNKSAILNFFEKLQSSCDRYPYVVDALIRGASQQPGISRLKATSFSQEHDWRILLTGIQEKIKPSSIYSCTTLTADGMHTFAEITFDKHTQTWQIIPRTTDDKNRL